MDEIAQENAKQTIQEVVQSNIVSSNVREISQNKHVDLEMMKTIPEDDAERSVSVI